MRRILLSIFCLTVALAHATEARPKEFHDPEVQRLLTVEMFAFGGVGIAGRISEGESAFRSLVRKKEAIRHILAAFEYGNEHARCYALVALRESSPGLFRESLARMRKNPPKEIVTMSGCIVSRLEPQRVFDAIERGTFSEWFKHHEGE